MGPFRDSQPEGEFFEGVHFPSEAEWLDLPADPDSAAETPVSSDFVERTMRALRSGATGADKTAEPQVANEQPGNDLAGNDLAGSDPTGSDLPADLLRAFAAPEPGDDFVARTVAAVRADRLARWRELLAQYIAPEPSPEFVARTLSALTADRRAADREAGAWADPMAVRRGRSWRRSTWPLLAAAAMLLWLATGTSPRDPIELRLAQREPAAFAYSYAATPLPAVLASLSHAADPSALNDGGADGVWLMLGSKE